MIKSFPFDFEFNVLSTGSSVVGIVLYFVSFVRGFVASVWFEAFPVGNRAAIQIAET